MSWKNLRIGTKLMVGFGIVLALLAIVGVWSIVGIGSIVKNGSDVIQGNALRSEILQREVDHLNWASNVSKFVYDDNMSTLSVQTDPRQCAFGKWYYGEGRATAQKTLPAIKALLDSIERPHMELHQSAAEIAKARASGDNGAVRNLYTGTTQARLAEVQDILKRIVKTTDENVLSSDDLIAHAKRTRLIVGVLVLVALPLGIFLALITARGIARPLENSVAFAQKIARGDLTARLANDGEDEVGQLSRALDSMGDNLRVMFGKISGGISTLAASSTQMKGLSGQMGQSVASTSQKALALAGESEGLAVNVQGVSAAMEQSSTNVQAVASATEQMTATLQEITKSTANSQIVSEEAVEKMNMLMSNVKSLGSASQEIGKVTETISEISEQTKLLALNATIEAARAGEAGKGFAVVASEIKELARQTAKANSEIARKISGIQSSTGQTVAGIEAVSGIIEQVNGNMLTISAALEEQSVTTAEIAKNVTEISHAITDVNGQLAQSNQSVCEMMSDLIEVSTFAQEIDKMAVEMNESATSLSGLSEELREGISGYKIG